MSEEKFTQGYDVTPDGRVFSLTSNWRGYGIREMKQDLNSHGYPRVRLTINGIRKSFLVHKLVAEKYLPDRPSNQHEIRHLDDNKKNNNYLNLAWGTRKDNAADRSKNGHTSKGILHSIAVREGQHKSKNKWFKHAR